MNTIENPDFLKTAIAESGLFESAYIQTKDLIFYPEIRQICEGNGCHGYGRSWACPPATGTLEECRARVLQYDTMLLFSGKYDVEDSYDFEGMKDGMLAFKKAVDRFDRRIKPSVSDYLLLSNEGCGRCETCTYPHAPCRFPELLHHSLEGYGFFVSELAKKAGISYNNGSNSVTFFGALLFHSDTMVQTHK